MSESRPKVESVKLQELSDVRPAGPSEQWVKKQLDLISDVKVSLSVRLGSCEVSVAALFALKAGETLVLDQVVDAPVDLILEGRTIARGQIVVVDDHFGVKISELLEADL